MFVKSLSRARGFLDRGNAPWHSKCTPSTPGAEWNLEVYAYEIAQTHTQTLSEVDLGSWMGWWSWSAATLGTLLRFAMPLSHSLSLGMSFALATGSLSLERNECANVSQVGFIKKRGAGTPVLTPDNSHVPRGSRQQHREMLTCRPRHGHIRHKTMQIGTNVYLYKHW